MNREEIEEIYREFLEQIENEINHRKKVGSVRDRTTESISLEQLEADANWYRERLGKN